MFPHPPKILWTLISRMLLQPTVLCAGMIALSLIFEFPNGSFPGCCNKNRYLACKVPCFFIGILTVCRGQGGQSKLLVSFFQDICSLNICLRVFSCLIPGPLSHLTGLIIRLIAPASVIRSSSLDPSSIQKIQRPCQLPWTLVSTRDTPNSHSRTF